MAAAEPLPYQIYLGRTPSYDRLQEILDTDSGVPELHVEYCEHGWYVYRRFDIMGTETSPSGEERALTDHRSQFIRRRDEEECTVLPNVVMRWVFYNECLVYQLVVQRYRSENMVGRVVCTMELAAGPPSFEWQDRHGFACCARILSWHNGVAWVIRLEAYRRSTPRTPGVYYHDLVYSRSLRAWLLGRDGDVVPRHIARQLSRAIGFQTRDGFW
jgi:hypothetical protein